MLLLLWGMGHILSRSSRRALLSLFLSLSRMSLSGSWKLAVMVVVLLMLLSLLLLLLLLLLLWWWQLLHRHLISVRLRLTRTVGVLSFEDAVLGSDLCLSVPPVVADQDAVEDDEEDLETDEEHREVPVLVS